MKIQLTSWDDYVAWLSSRSKGETFKQEGNIMKASEDFTKSVWGIQQVELGKPSTPYQPTHIDDSPNNPCKSNNTQGIKESEGKLFYELDWNFITQMAERMSTNDKYPVFNWKKPMDVEELKQALFRHVIEIMKGNYEDDGREFGHLEAISTNIMLINYQLKNFK